MTTTQQSVPEVTSIHDFPIVDEETTIALYEESLNDDSDDSWLEKPRQSMRRSARRTSEVVPTESEEEVGPCSQCEKVPTNENCDERDTCVICLDEITCPHEARALECGHKAFHKKCIARWLDHSPTCPLCKRHAENLVVVTST